MKYRCFINSFLYLTGIHFRGELQHGGDVSQQKVKCRPIRTREIGATTLSDILYVYYEFSKVATNSVFKTNLKGACVSY